MQKIILILVVTMISLKGFGQEISDLDEYLFYNNNCVPTTSSINVSACGTYDLPSGNATYTTGGTYTLIDTISNACGEDSIITIQLTLDTIDPFITIIGQSMIANQSNAIYQWINCQDMSSINGETNQSYVPTSDGDYAVTITTQSGCLFISPCIPFVVSNTKICIVENKLKIYPNPSDGNVSIDLGKSYPKTTITLTDLMGKAILTKTYNRQQLLDLNLTEPSGMYLLIIENSDIRSVARFIIE